MPRPDSRIREELGAIATEYALLAFLIAVVIVGAVTIIGLTTRGFFEAVLPAF